MSTILAIWRPLSLINNMSILPFDVLSTCVLNWVTEQLATPPTWNFKTNTQRDSIGTSFAIYSFSPVDVRGISRTNLWAIHDFVEAVFNKSSCFFPLTIILTYVSLYHIWVFMEGCEDFHLITIQLSLSGPFFTKSLQYPSCPQILQVPVLAPFVRLWKTHDQLGLCYEPWARDTLCPASSSLAEGRNSLSLPLRLLSNVLLVGSHGIFYFFSKFLMPLNLFLFHFFKQFNHSWERRQSGSIFLPICTSSL